MIIDRLARLRPQTSRTRYGVYGRWMARTTIDIDDAACLAVMERFQLGTKGEPVNLALRPPAPRLRLERRSERHADGVRETALSRYRDCPT